MMNFFSAFSVKYQTQNPSPSLFIFGVPLASLSLPRVTGQIFPTTVVIAGESEEQPDTRGPSPKWFAFSLPREAILFSVDSTTQAMTPLGKCPGPSLQPMGTLTPVAHNLPNTPMARAFIYQCVVSVRGSIPPGGIWKSGGGGCLWSPSSYGY